MELITVIIPVYNVEPYLQRCVDSVRNQSYQNLEIILVDDGSPDRCPQMCDEFQLKDPRIKVVHKKNGGLGYARNSGLDAATGIYVTFIDSDDWVSVDHINNLYTAAKKYDADVAIGGHTSVSTDGRILESHECSKKGVFEKAQILSDLLLPLIGPAPTYTKDVQFESSSCMNLYCMDIISKFEIRFPSEKNAVAEDMFFNIDYFFRAEKVVITDEIGYFYFQNMESISRKYDPKRFERTIRFYELMNSKVLDFGMKDAENYRVERTFLMKIRILLRLVVMSDLTFKQKMKEIKKILEHELVQGVLQRYPISTMIPAMRLLSRFMLKKNILGVYFLMKAREFARYQSGMKAVLKKIGIGR